MLHFNSMRALANRYSGLAEKSASGGMPLMMERTLRTQLNEISRIWVAAARRSLQKQVYDRYIPSRGEYEETRPKNVRVHGGDFVRQSVVTVSADRFARQVIANSDELVRQQREMFGRDIGLKIAREIEASQGDRAWQRTGDLLDYRNWLVILYTNPGDNPTGSSSEAGITLRNYAVNERGEPYAYWRATLGFPGRTKNSVWTLRGNWQFNALMEIRPLIVARMKKLITETWKKE